MFVLVTFASIIVIVTVLLFTVDNDTATAADTEVECHFVDPRNATCEIRTLLEFDNKHAFHMAAVPNASAVLELRLTQPCRLYVLPPAFGAAFPQLHKLEANRAGITAIKAADFVSAAHLVHLELMMNDIRVVPRAAFAVMHRLEELRLNYSRIETIEDYALANLTRLKRLTLTGNHLTAITAQMLAGADHLEILALDHNEVHTIAADALRLPKLVSLWIGYNRLVELPQRLCALAPILEELRFDGNRVQRVADTFYGCGELTYVNGDANGVADLSMVALGGMRNLIIASFANNNRLVLDNGDGDKAVDLLMISPLLSLDISGNHLDQSDIFRRLAIFGKLQIIKLNRNEFENMQDVAEISKLFPSLRIVEMYDNPKIAAWSVEHAALLQRANITLRTR